MASWHWNFNILFIDIKIMQKTNLTAKNKITAINQLAVPALQYPGSTKRFRNVFQTYERLQTVFKTFCVTWLCTWNDRLAKEYN